VPGSHLLTMEEYSPLLPAGGKGQPAGAIPVLAKAGDVLLFDRRLRRARAGAARPFPPPPRSFLRRESL
jgi:hypothetical protein